MTTLQDAAFGATGGGPGRPPGGPGGSSGPSGSGGSDGRGTGRRRGGAGTGADLPAWIGGAAGIVGLLALWWVLAVTVLDNGGVVPTPWEVVRALWDDHRLMWTSVTSTVQIAAKGWLIGNGLAIGLAVVFFGVPVVERVLLQIGVASYCLPIIAIGPILTTVFDGSTPQIALAGISVFFTTMVGTLLGLRAADPASLDVVRASGGGAWKQMRYIRLRAALPSTFAGLQIAAPAAVLGAIIGEFLGADRGLGVAMVHSQQALEVPRTWALAVVASAVAGLGYALTALVARLLTPWAPRGNPGGGL
ncbi:MULTISPECIES: ABC transporter permease [Frankia]|uniref:ABC transporter, permease protein n=1 Tax=Frankia alni (strain DSM 45986 / CECT 9034 / ACN14a) TaxID=326424 RepID=Q0RQR5_FRAAA|nr:MULTISPECIES: ABC transporter permease subunit [Frankia]CAJ60108.1 putative ABC transporter, permease protein [Frankia alni ACN14a]